MKVCCVTFNEQFMSLVQVKPLSHKLLSVMEYMNDKIKDNIANFVNWWYFAVLQKPIQGCCLFPCWCFCYGVVCDINSTSCPCCFNLFILNPLEMKHGLKQCRHDSGGWPTSVVGTLRPV